MKRRIEQTVTLVWQCFAFAQRKFGFRINLLQVLAQNKVLTDHLSALAADSYPVFCNPLAYSGDPWFRNRPETCYMHWHFS
jgi:hypothetical protein